MTAGPEEADPEQEHPPPAQKCGDRHDCFMESWGRRSKAT
jgi:hypothetical protein